MIDNDRRAKWREYARKWRAEHPERQRAINLRYAEKHRRPRPEPPGFDRDYTAAELAYSAGVVDGEGNLQLTKWGTSFLPLVTVTNTDRRLIDWFAERFPGGQIHTRGRHNSTHKPALDWRVSGKRAAQFAALVLPYLVLKRAQAELLIEYYADGTFHWGNRPLPPEVLERRRQMHEAMKAMNKRGNKASFGAL